MNDWNPTIDELYYWKCDKCNVFHLTEDLHQARIEADQHDKIHHDKKPLTNFGVEKFNFELGID